MRLSKLTERTTPGAKPNVHYGFWVITMCHVDTLIETNDHSGGGVLIVKEAVHVCGGVGGI